MKSDLKNGSFIQKLQSILENEEYKQIIGWVCKNTAVEIISPKKMEEEILPLYFRHSKFQSFVRQLNIYGFKKIKSVERHRFTHPLLQSGYKLTSITSIKNTKQRQVHKNCNHEMAPNTIQSPQNAVVQETLSKQAGSSTYSSIGQNRNSILLEKDLNQNPQNLWQTPNFTQLMFIPNHYLMWNYMSSFNGFQTSSSILNTETSTP